MIRHLLLGLFIVSCACASRAGRTSPHTVLEVRASAAWGGGRSGTFRADVSRSGRVLTEATTSLAGEVKSNEQLLDQAARNHLLSTLRAQHFESLPSDLYQVLEVEATIYELDMAVNGTWHRVRLWLPITQHPASPEIERFEAIWEALRGVIEGMPRVSADMRTDSQP
jgi:hypothetical protein